MTDHAARDLAAIMTIDDTLDDVGRARIWARLADRLETRAPARSAALRWWGAGACAAAAVLAVAVLVHRDPEPVRELVAPAEATLAMPLGPHARAALVGPGRIELEPADAGGAATTANLVSGTLYAQFEGGAGRTLRIVAPGAVVDVVGTLFAVEARDTGSCVSVAHGRVRVTAGVRVVEVGGGERWCTNDRTTTPIEPRIRDALARHETIVAWNNAPPAPTSVPTPQDVSRASLAPTATTTATAPTALTAATASTASTASTTSVGSSVTTGSKGTTDTTGTTGTKGSPASPASTTSTTSMGSIAAASARPSPPSLPASSRPSATSASMGSSTKPSAQPSAAPAMRPSVTPSATPSTTTATTQPAMTPAIGTSSGTSGRASSGVRDGTSMGSSTGASGGVPVLRLDQQLFREAEAALARRDTEAADNALARLIADAPTSPLLDQALLERARIAHRRHAWSAARAELDALARVRGTPLAESGRWLACRVAVDAGDADAGRCLAEFRTAYPGSAHDVDALGLAAQVAHASGGCAAAGVAVDELARRYGDTALARAWSTRCREAR